MVWRGRVCLWWVLFLVQSPRKLQRSLLEEGAEPVGRDNVSQGKLHRVTVLFLFCLSR